MERNDNATFRKLPRKTKVAELCLLLSLYDKLRENREFQRDCREFDRIDAHTDVGAPRTAEAVVQFYLKWSVYPIPEFLVNDHNFRVSLEQFFLRRQRVFNIPVSPLTTKADVLQDFRQIQKDIRRPKKVPDLKRLRVALVQKWLIDRSAFHAFKPSDFAMIKGSRSRKGRMQKTSTFDGETTIVLSRKELKQSEQLLRELVRHGTSYKIADRQAMRQIVKKRWREAPLTPKIRMEVERAFRTLKALLFHPNK